MAVEVKDDAPRGLYASEERDLDAMRVLKVKLPLRQHIQLHSMRVLQGEGISVTVAAALQMYFERMREQELARGAPPMSGGPGLHG